ncbi:MAG: diguanylate cyclase [Desulfuromonadales bacterium]|nr:diguanylate cyclase [Desulfuromonadales bacterium]
MTEMISGPKTGGQKLYFSLSPAWRWFWFPLIILYLFSVTIIYLWSQNEYATLISHIEDDELRFIELYQSKISDSMDHIFFDLQWFSQQNALAAWLETNQPDELQELVREYVGLLSVRPAYYQLRLFDEAGQEVFQIGRDRDIPVATLQEQRQDNTESTLLKETGQLERGTVLVSPMELNIERGQVEVPYRPVIRFITPVYDIHDHWRGSLLISYQARAMTDVLRSMSDKVSGSLMLVNKAGYWLVAENPADEWGSMVEERRERLFYRDYPQSWVQLQPDRKGQFITEDGLFTFTTIDLQSVFGNSYQKTRTLPPLEVVAPDVEWKIISHVPAERLSARLATLEKFKWIFLGLAFLASLLISSLFYRNRNRQKSHQEELEKMAYFDNLTGLTSRALFVDQLNDLLHLSRREGDHFALMVVDLDGFKQINDTFGHQGGDRLLCMVAERLKHNVRSTDTVARTGGDEFSIILSRVEHADVAHNLAEKILKSLQLPFQISGRHCHIGASIGFSVSTEQEQAADVLWKQADIAMYRAKQSGKNRICSFSVG